MSGKQIFEFISYFTTFCVLFLTFSVIFYCGFCNSFVKIRRYFSRKINRKHFFIDYGKYNFHVFFNQNKGKNKFVVYVTDENFHTVPNMFWVGNKKDMKKRYKKICYLFKTCNPWIFGIIPK